MVFGRMRERDVVSVTTMCSFNGAARTLSDRMPDGVWMRSIDRLKRGRGGECRMRVGLDSSKSNQ